MCLRKFSVLLAIFLFFLTPLAFAKGQFVNGELLIRQTVKAHQKDVEKALQSVGGDVLEELPQIRVKRIRVSESAMDKIKAALTKNPNFEFVEENFLAQGSAVPNDPSYYSQWHHNTIMTPSSWDYSTGSTEIPIAIIDSGVDPDHPDLVDKLIPGYNFLEHNSDTHDVLGHGTAVAGSAAASGNNSTGVAGVAWQNPIMPLVALDSSNWATYTNIANAIIYAVDNGAKVINISIGGPSSSYTLENAVNYAWNNGVLVFACAQNYNTSTPYYPAACTNAVAVSATDEADNRPSFSNYGDWITLSAPGVSILTTNNGGGYGSWSGTSFSSPITAGVAALVWSANPSLSHHEVLEILKNSADDLGDSGFDIIYGYGRVNAYNAMLEAINYEPKVDCEAPTVNLTSPTDYTTVSGIVTITASASDNNAVEKVTFSIDGKIIDSDTSAPYSTVWNTDGISSGTYTIQVKAVDTAGNESDIVSVPIYIEAVDAVEEPVAPPATDSDATAPDVVILSPGNGTDITSKTKVHVSASDNNAVVKLNIYVNGERKVSKDTDSLLWRWNTRKIPTGTYLIRAEALDAAGNIGVDEITLYK